MKGLGSVSVTPIYGWGSVLGEHFDARDHVDGFHFVLLVLDGDIGGPLGHSFTRTPTPGDTPRRTTPRPVPEAPPSAQDADRTSPERTAGTVAG